MMKTTVFSLFDHAPLIEAFKKNNNYEIGKILLRQFPDEEIYVKIESDVKGRKILFVASLDRSNDKILPLLFAAKTARDLGAKEVGLIAPYLAYMRQDKQFHPGEGVTARYFANILSNYFDWLVTVDPHLHRIQSLQEVFSIPATVIHATDEIVHWIKTHINCPLLIGPDRESKQWVEQIANDTQAPFLILEKKRRGDQDVEISLPEIHSYPNCTPILIDDIISTAKTMIETIKHLKNLKMKLPVCIAIHGIFAGNAYEELLKTGAVEIITCNTIPHSSNRIDLSGTIIEYLSKT